MKKRLILATNNKDKIFEISKILDGLQIEILSANDFDDFPDVEETGETLAENATLKAVSVFAKYGLPCVADDTGLEVDYLNGEPGVKSARFAGEGCSYADNNKKLLKLLEGVPTEMRSARFKTVIAFADFEGRIHTVEGILDGIIADDRRGSYGFGYDPVFIVADKTIRLAEMPPEEKNRISHRGRALEKIRPIILRAFKIDT
ncbi:MAG: RdgB/HAM1 family non-canonical purine NTP pyrophosphatase [Candidatus Zixiibacteriota bacterium]|nr:MAG: RdgB/HAM1 family non-canonical purine NTP pyrophosphatase [candidate division Zixibacteria bacterium]